MLNSLLFILIGLQLPTILEGISEDYSPTTLTLYAAAVCLAVIVARFVWIFPATYLPRRASAAAQGARPLAPLAERCSDRLLGDAGGGLHGRGARSSRRVSGPRSRPLSDLLCHLRHPRGPGSDVAATDPVARHPRRWGPRERGNQGPPPGGGGGSRADRRAGRGGFWVYEGTAEKMRSMYGYRRRRFATRHASATDKRVADFAADLDGDDEDYETRSAAFQRFRRELLEAEARPCYA